MSRKTGLLNATGANDGGGKGGGRLMIYHGFLNDR